MIRTLSLTLSGLALASAAAAQSASNDSGVYVNAGVTLLSADLELGNTDIAGQTVDLGNPSPNIFMITGRVGYQFNKYFAIEGDAGFGLGGDDFNQTVPVTTALGTVDVDADVTADVKYYAGAFVKGTLPISEQFDIFVRGGYGLAEAEVDGTASALGFSASASDSETTDDFAFGAGAQFNFNAQNGIRFDYSTLGGDADIFSLTYAFKF